MFPTRAWRFLPDGRFEWTELSLRPPAAGEVLVKLRACGLCTGEVMDWYIRQKAPLVPGHELVGEIEALGEGVQGFHVGQRVVVHHHAPCGQCALCRRGAFVHCPTWRATRLEPGGLSERFLVPSEIVRTDLIPLPDSVPDEVGVFVEPLACVVKSLRRAGNLHRATVAIIGMGVMGMLHLLLAQWWGAAQVLAIDRLPHRLQQAESLGAIPIEAQDAEHAVAQVQSRTQGYGAEVVIVGPGTLEALELGWRLVAPDGALILFTPAPPEVRYALDWYTLYFKEVRLIPSYSAGPVEMRHALGAILAGLPVAQLITHQLPLSEAPQGYALLRQAEALKVVVKP
ncbi:Erythritol/L-threitol dehydrogenase [bacterium HR14]|nr:Erythritol/L-threitol dehydrogenase [bacterium HR14]